MSKIRLLKIWLCIGMLLAFLSGGTMSWFLNQFLHRLEALPATPEASEEWKERLIRDLGLDETQQTDLEAVLDEWQMDRLDLQREYQPRWREIQLRYEERIQGLLRPEQLERYQGGV